MAKNVSGSGPINSTSVRGWFGKGGGGVETNNEMRPASDQSRAGNRQASVAVNGMMPQGNTEVQGFHAEGQSVGRPSYAAGTKQTFRPKTRGKVSG